MEFRETVEIDGKDYVHDDYLREYLRRDIEDVVGDGISYVSHRIDWDALIDELKMDWRQVELTRPLRELDEYGYDPDDPDGDEEVTATYWVRG